MVTFTPSVWLAEGDRVNAAADAFSSAAEGAITARKISARTSSQIEQAAVRGDSRCQDQWLRIIGVNVEAMTILGSKMTGTGSDYAATEDAAEAAARRFW